jgi:hypothetical protein
MMIAVAEGEDVSIATETLASGFVASTSDLKAGVEAFKSKQEAIFSRS